MSCNASYVRFIFGKFFTSTIILYALLFAQIFFILCKKWMLELNDDIQFQLLSTNYPDFQHMVDKAIIIENKIKETEKDGKRKMSFHRQSFGSNIRSRFL
jgi:hypothetical protein